MDEVQLKVTEDGSHTLFSPRVGECYHSQHGAVQESRHVFIDAGWRQCAGTELRVLEVGFGTGLNAFLTLLEAGKTGRHIHYTTIERYPLDDNIIKELRYPELIAPEQAGLFQELHQTEWNVPQEITPYFTLLKIEGDFTRSVFEGGYDVVYFDAFAPEKQPEMWSQPLFDYLYTAMNEDGILTTYCAKGSVRRMLQAAGFTVERLPGPPEGKREILRATKKPDTKKN